MVVRRVAFSMMVSLVVSALAESQLDNGLPGPQPLDAGALALNRQLLSGIMDHNQEVRDGKPNAGGTLVYRRDPSITEKVKREYLVRAQKAYGEQVAAGLRQFLATNDFVAIWSRGAAGDGMRSGDLGDSLAEYWSTNWAIAHGDRSTSPALTKALRYQIGPVVARNPTVRRLGAAQKQEIAEGLMLNLVVQAIGAEAAHKKGDPAVEAKLRQSTASRFKQDFGIDLLSVKLTNRGFVRT